MECRQNRFHALYTKGILLYWWSTNISILHVKEVEDVYWFHFVRPSVPPSVPTSVRWSVRASVDQIVSALYLLHYFFDPFHIHTSYQPTSAVCRVARFVCKLLNLNFSYFIFHELLHYILASYWGETDKALYQSNLWSCVACNIIYCTSLNMRIMT